MSNLNGAYYGPSIPPPAKPSKSYHRPGRGSSSCNPFSCCCGCLFNCLCTCVFQIICTILLIIALAAFIFWLIVRPNQLKFYATNATLTQFNFETNNRTLYYNLALDLSIRNPNKRIGVYYDNIEVRALYEGERFASRNLQTFYQGHKNTTTFDNIVLQGQNLVLLGNDDVSEYNEDRNSGTFDIDVKIYLRLRFKVGLVKTAKFKPKIHCDLKLPLNTNGTTASGTTFQSTRCDYDW
ncbi:hypothetical protein Leryth_022391 [Lithospermum erythrorhizon]|nr:hypothetical protein Leryth_022391 [Lithospermum erythrorhizon]